MNKQSIKFPVEIIVADPRFQEVEIEIAPLRIRLYDLSDITTGELYRHYELGRFPYVAGEVELVYHEAGRLEVYLHDVRFRRSGQEVSVSLDQYNWDKIEDGLNDYLADEVKYDG